jgi:hypothetical protein
MSQQTQQPTTSNSPVYYYKGNPTDSPELTIARTPYMLEIHDFERITDSSFGNKSVELFLGATIGLFINMIAKLIGNKIDPSVQFDIWEVIACVIAGFATVVSLVIAHYVPNKRRRVIRKISQHFGKF